VTDSADDLKFSGKKVLSHVFSEITSVDYFDSNRSSNITHFVLLYPYCLVNLAKRTFAKGLPCVFNDDISGFEELTDLGGF